MAILRNMSNRETIQSEILEILRYNLARLERFEARSPGLWADEIVAHRREIARVAAGEFHAPSNYVEREAHLYGLKLARQGVV